MTPEQQQADRLARFEQMLAGLRGQYDSLTAQMASLKAQGKTRTATYRQLMAQRLTVSQMLECCRVYGLLD